MPTATSSALRISTLANMGAYLSTFAPCIPTYLYATLLAGVYKTPVIYCEVKAVFTNTVPVDAYRGAGRPEATFLLERLVDACAHDTGMDRVAIRRQNFIAGGCLPLPDAGRAAIRQRQLPGDAGCLPEGGRLCRLRSSVAPRLPRAASCAASASPPTSRPAASRHRPWWDRSARAPGCTRWRTSGCIPPAASRSYRHAQPRPGTRDHAGATRVRSAWRADGSDRRRARRHREDPVRHGHLWQPQPRRRRQRDGEGDGQGHRQGQEDRRPSDGSLGRRHRVQERHVHRRRHRQVEDADRHLARRLRAAQLSDRGTGTGSRRDRVLRSEELHLPRPAATSPRWRSTRIPAWSRW